MFPKEYQDMCFQQAPGVSADSEVKYIELRNEIMSIANQEVFMITPTPMAIDAVNQQGGSEWNDMWGYGGMSPPGMGWEDPQYACDIDSVGKGNGFGKGRGKGDGSCIFVDNLGIGPGNVQTSARDEEKGNGLVSAGRGQANLGLVR